MVKRGHRCTGPKHHKEKRSMDYFAGLDVSVKDTSVCIVDDAGKIVREIKVVSEPDALLQVLRNPAYCLLVLRTAAGPAHHCGRPLCAKLVSHSLTRFPILNIQTVANPF